MNSSERITRFDETLIRLRSMILAGEFPVHRRLSETALADQLDISRTPLRQAMAKLVEEHLLERIETGGCRVASFSVEDIYDAIELRGILEGTAARLAAERGADHNLLHEAEEIVEQLNQTVAPQEIDFASYVSLNAQFHQVLSALAGSRVMKRELDRMTQLPLASPSAFLQGQELFPNFRESLRRAQRQHRAILSAIQSREGSRAEALAREHARLARENLEFLITASPEITKQVPGLALVSNA
jgi:GntR family transcriptional regulator of vanillate catabolism